MTAFDPDSSTNGMLDRGWEAPRNHERGPEDMAQAVADLLRHKSLISTFGDQGEWEVRTTLAANRQAWRYHSSVFLHGKERKRGFPPIDVDRTREIRHTETVTDELLAAFAREAAEVHVARCDGIKEYLTLASHLLTTCAAVSSDEKGGFGPAECRCSPNRLLVVDALQRHRARTARSTVTILPHTMAATPNITPLPSWRAV